MTLEENTKITRKKQEISHFFSQSFLLDLSIEI